MAWQIDHDFIDEADGGREGYAEEHTRIPIAAAAAGFQSELLPVTENDNHVTFRLYDDDGELYYEGSCHDDDECLNQEAALRWAEGYAGCTTIKVLRNGAWTQEIG